MSSMSPADAVVAGLRRCYTQAPLDAFPNCVHLHPGPAIPKPVVWVGGIGNRARI